VIITIINIIVNIIIIVYCVASAESELFKSRATCAAQTTGDGRISPKTQIVFPHHEPHILFFVTPLYSSMTEKFIQGSMQQLDHNSTSIIFHKRIDLVLFILSVAN